MIDCSRNVVYRGVRTDYGKRQWLSFSLISDDGMSLGGECLFDKKSFKGFSVSVGTVCKADMKVSGGSLQTIIGIPKPISVWHNKAEIASMRILHDACLSTVSAYNQASKDCSDVVLQCMKPLREAYKQTNSLGKTAIEVRVLNYLRNGRDLH